MLFTLIKFINSTIFILLGEQKKMLVLGVESTAHSFGIGIIDSDKKEVLFMEKNAFSNDSGMDPREIAEYHVENFDKILDLSKEYLKSIGKEFSDLDLISFSRGPGLGGSLKVGSLVAKTLALKYNVPIIGVNHLKAHLEFGKMLTGADDPIFLMVSGVNTQIIAKDEFNTGYKIYGETEDIGLGNLLDSFARLVGLDFPGGPIIEKLAKNSDNYIDLPYNLKGMNVNLAGIYSTLKQRLEKGAKIEDLCYSLQETVFAMVLEIVERAIAYTKKKSFIVVGGVSANQRLTDMAKEMCKQRGIEYHYFNLKYAMDNGAMIAWQGFIDREKSSKSIADLKPQPYINVESEI